MTALLPNTPYTIDRIVYTIGSASNPGGEYTPFVDADGWHCQCKGYQYRHTCRHIREASEGKSTTKPLVKLGIRREARSPAGVVTPSDLWA